MLLLGGALVFGGAASQGASAQGGVSQGGTEGCLLPDQIDEELAALFEAELNEVFVEFNPDGSANAMETLQNTLGEPGQRDLPPGQLIINGITNDLSGLPCPEEGGGSKLSGECLGMAMSFDDNGDLLAVAADLSPDDAPIDILASRAEGQVVQAFTKDNPFKVHVNGFVAYVGLARNANGDGPQDHDWEITTFGAALDSGGDPNSDNEDRNAGAVNLKDDLPSAAKYSALFKIEGELTSANGFECKGSGYFETEGGLPVPQGVGVAALIGAGLGALFNARPAKTWRG
jgi:hypothetical protein